MAATAVAEIVGRDDELAAVARFLDADAVGRRALVIEGEAGIGKTTIWSHGVAHARGSLVWVLSTRPTEADTAFAYAGLTDLLEPVLPETLPKLPRPQRLALEVALLRAEGAVDPHVVSAAVLNVVRALAALARVVVAIDDVQWLDPSTAGALEFALRRLEREPVLVLASRRIGTKRKPALELERALDRNTERLTVGPLDLDSIARILRSQLGRSFARPTLGRIHAASGGNPFYALEIAAGLGDVLEETAELPLPKNLHDLVRARLARLAPATRRALLFAAALAQPTVAVVEDAGGEGTRDALAAAEAADVISFERDHIRFAHPLLAAAIYAEGSTEQRRALHRALAAVVGDPEERARHLALAAAGPDEEVAAALEAAAAASAARGAVDAAAELCERAWQLTPAALEDDLHRRRIDATEFWAACGDYAHARLLLEETIPVLDAGPLRARARVGLGVIQAYGFDDWEQAFSTLEAALTEVGDELVLRATTERQLAWLMAGSFHPIRAEPHARAALEIAERLGDRVLLAEALGALAFVEFMLGRGVRLELIERALALDTAYEHRRIQRNPLWPFMHILVASGRLRRARNVLAEISRIAQERGEEAARPWILAHQSGVEELLGNLDLAERLAAEALEVGLQTGQTAAAENARFGQAEIDAIRGRVERARSFCAERLSKATAPERERAEAHRLLGFIELSLGNTAAVAEHHAAAAAQEEAVGAEVPGMFGYTDDHIEALIALNRLDEARSLIESLEEHGDRNDEAWSIARGARCRALLLAATGDLTEAIDAAERAVATHDRVDVALDRARNVLVKGTIERRAKLKRAGRTSLKEALRQFEEIGAGLWAQKTRDELARIGGRASTEGLTATERQIADLVASGSTNREVAETMFISVKTVEANLSRIYRKLGVSSRRELARARVPQT